MSERYSTCKACEGQGQIPDPDKPVEVEVSSLLRRPVVRDAKGEMIFPTHIRGFMGRECGTCGGTGHSGDALD